MTPETGLLLITWNFPPRRGGIEKLLAGLSHELEKVYPLFVVTSYAATEEGQKARVFRAKQPGLLSYWLYAAWKAPALLRQHPEIKVLLGGSAMVTPLALVAAKLFRRKCVVMVHGLDVIYPNPVYQWLCVRWLRKCDRVIANSRYTASLAAKKGVAPDRITVIHPGVHCESFSADGAEARRVEMGLKGRKVLLYVGRLAKRKGVEEFIRESMPRIIAEIPEVCLLVAGENPTESLTHHQDILGKLTQTVVDMGMENYVRLLGAVSDRDLACLYRLSDLVVLPALHIRDDVEGFGIVLIEAAAAGKPCVATRVGGIPDAVEDGKSGLLVDLENYTQVTQAIVHLLRDEEARLAMGRYAQKTVRAKFSWDAIAQKYEEVFNALPGSQEAFTRLNRRRHDRLPP